jgi:hypothetical protein
MTNVRKESQEKAAAVTEQARRQPRLYWNGLELEPPVRAA